MIKSVSIQLFLIKHFRDVVGVKIDGLWRMPFDSLNVQNDFCEAIDDLVVILHSCDILLYDKNKSGSDSC